MYTLEFIGWDYHKTKQYFRPNFSKLLLPSKKVKRYSSSNNYQPWSGTDTRILYKPLWTPDSMWTKFNERIFMFIAEAIGNKCATADVEKKNTFLNRYLWIQLQVCLAKPEALHTPLRHQRINNKPRWGGNLGEMRREVEDTRGALQSWSTETKFILLLFLLWAYSVELILSVLSARIL